VIIPTYQDAPPLTERVNAYDKAQFVTYIRLLDAAAENADWREVAHIVFGLDPENEFARAKAVHDSHLARAQWMVQSGYRHLLEPK
jgi:Uncharacterized conserved protein (DUF2285)